jgi:NAD+ kinase
LSNHPWRVPFVAQKPPKRLGIIAKPNEPRASIVANTIAEWAKSHGIALLVDSSLITIPASATPLPQEEVAASSDLLVVLGGDGTMIGAARLVGGRGTPVLGINLGWLGYLTEFAVEDTVLALDQFVSGDFEAEHRTMLDWECLRNDVRAGAATVLNDVAINRSALSRVIEIHCWIGNRAVTTYRGDGLIVATPTGSTAYNLSAGGPIIYPGTPAICLAPICPHTLTNRPIVLPDTVEIQLRIDTREQEVMLTSDGQTGMPLLTGDVIKLRKSSNTFNTVLPKDRDYFQILRDKLKWSGS